MTVPRIVSVMVEVFVVLGGGWFLAIPHSLD